MNVPKPLHKILNKTCYYHDLGYDYSVAAKQAIRLRDKYKRLYRSLKSKTLSTTDTGVSILNAHGIPPRKLIGDEILYLPDSFEEATKNFTDYEDLPEAYQQASNILRGVQTIKLTEALARYVKETQQAIDIFENPDRRLKTKNSRRSVPLVEPRVFQALVKHAEGKSKPDEPMFPSMFGKAISNSVSAVLVKSRSYTLSSRAS